MLLRKIAVGLPGEHVELLSIAVREPRAVLKPVHLQEEHARRDISIFRQPKKTVHAGWTSGVVDVPHPSGVPEGASAVTLGRDLFANVIEPPDEGPTRSLAHTLSLSHTLLASLSAPLSASRLSSLRPSVSPSLNLLATLSQPPGLPSIGILAILYLLLPPSPLPQSIGSVSPLLSLSQSLGAFSGSARLPLLLIAQGLLELTRGVASARSSWTL